MKKRIIILSIVIILIVIVSVGIFLIFKNKSEDKGFLADVNRDIVIEVRGGDLMVGGYAETYYEYYIDIGKKKIYYVEDYYVYGEKDKEKNGHNYRLKSTKELSNEELKTLLDATKLDSNYSKPKNNNSMGYLFSQPIYYRITYNNKTTEITKDSVYDVAQILDSMK